MTSGERILKCRQLLGLTQQDFADLLSVTKGAVSSWEADRYEPGKPNEEKIAQVMGITRSEYLENKLPYIKPAVGGEDATR